MEGAAEERRRKKRPESPPTDSGSEEPTAAGDEAPPAPAWKTVRDCGVASDRNARFRRTMEDAHRMLEFDAGDDGSVGAYFAVYDGHGGRGAVNFVHEHLHNNFREQLELGVELPEAWLTSFQKTDADMASADVGYSGSTVAAAYIHRDANGKRTLYTANCGDARVVLCRGGQGRRMTVDHKGTDPTEVKRIQDAGGLIILNRVSGILAVTRSMGDLKMKEYVIPDPYCETANLDEGDTHLVVACDGLWDVCSDQDVCDVLVDPAHESHAAQALANQLLIKSLRQGSTDNVSIIVIKL